MQVLEIRPLMNTINIKKPNIGSRIKANGVILAFLIACHACHNGSGDPRSASGDIAVGDAATLERDSIPLPERSQVLFNDSVNRAFFWDQTSLLQAVGDRALRVDGLTVLYIEQAPVPFSMHTALMNIEVLEVPLLLQVDAFDNEAGQSLELFSGSLKVEKSYPSDFPSLDTLHAGDLYMINKDIDLSEKEHLDDFRVQHWWESYSKSKGGQK